MFSRLNQRRVKQRSNNNAHILVRRDAGRDHSPRLEQLDREQEREQPGIRHSDAASGLTFLIFKIWCNKIWLSWNCCKQFDILRAQARKKNTLGYDWDIFIGDTTMAFTKHTHTSMYLTMTRQENCHSYIFKSD